MIKKDYKDLWNLDPEFKFLNHGSYGACPKYIQERQSFYRENLERQPLRFMLRDLEPMLLNSKKVLSDFVNADDEDIVFVPCATNGVNTILKSLDLMEGDEILTTDHEYFACKNAADFVAKKNGAKVVIATVPFPISEPDIIIKILKELVSSKTRLLLLDYITSPTGLVLPIPDIIREFNNLEIDTLIDGAHAPGMIPLNLNKLGATYFTGNCHKWLCTPKGSAFLYVRKDKQPAIHPLSYSHSYNEEIQTTFTPFQTEFYWSGTFDPSAYLCIGDAINYFSNLFPGGWDKVMKRNNQLALEARKLMCENLDIALPCPDEMIGALAAFPIPDSKFAGRLYRNFIDPIQDILYNDYKIEIPIGFWPAFPKKVMRLSAQLYNNIDEYKYLSDALKMIL